MPADDASRPPREPDPLGRPEPTVQDLLAQERVDVPWQLKEAPFHDIGVAGAPAAEYVSRAFFDREMTHLWGRAWQMACREDEIPNAGDHVLYEIGARSYIIVRGDDGAIRALRNVCLHRGRRLRDCAGRAAAFRCPFHGFTWSLDGALKETPTPWDFPHVNADNFALPQARVGTWGGFVFVCFDPAAPPLDAYLEDIPEIFARWPMEQRFTAAHVTRPLPCNWKVALEAFVESFHVTDTHPQAATYIGDFHTQYDVWEGKRHYSRMISPRGIASPSAGAISADEILQSSEPGGATLRVPEGSTPRREMAERRRAQVRDVLGPDLAKLTDSEAVDTIQYWIFPNLVLWWGHAAPIVYRFRPLGDDPERALMDVYLMPQAPHDAPRPKPAATTHLTADQPWAVAKELGGLGAVFDQDVGNFAALQAGLRAIGDEPTTLARYQENRIRYFHKVLREYLGDER
ncbi:MAG: Rieske 2Fe-2S domain-containing protein [Alphaproteobacteria bacterium]|nr:Rieske 2Fe-2S domain-containing protein [Alphaproteobacteria bacterium]